MNELTSLSGHSDRVLSVACAPNGTVCTSSTDKTVKLWKPQLDATTTPGCHDAPVTAVSLVEDGSLMVTASRDGCVKLWTSDNASESGKAPLPGSMHCALTFKVVFSLLLTSVFIVIEVDGINQTMVSL